MDRPVVVNSLLCFIHNFREILHTNQLRSLVSSYFSQNAISVAEAILAGLLPSHEVNPTLDLLTLYDKVIKHSQCSPIFAADDLCGLPLTLTSDDFDPASEILREVRQLKDSIQKLLGVKLDEFVNGTRSKNSGKELQKPSASPSSPESFANHTNSEVPLSLRTGERTSTGRRKDGSGHRLDAMVRKLTENRQREKAMESLANPLWNPQMMSTVAYMNIIRSMSLSAQSPIFPSVTTPQSISDHLPYINHDSAMEMETKVEDQNTDIVKKTEESSPSPSNISTNESSNAFSDLNNDKPYTCLQSNCNKRFANKFLLKKHQFIHTGLRPHRCPYCGKRFNRKDNLLRHRKTHISNALPNEMTNLTCEEILSKMDVGKQFTMQMGTDCDQNDDM